MTVAEALALIADSKGKVFTVEFIKRSNRELRRMNCRVGVKTGLAGGEPAYNPVEHDLIWVYEMSSQQRRSIPVEGLRWISCSGVSGEVTQDSNVS